MAWQNQSLAILRAMLGDLDDTTYLYSDDKLIKVLLVGGFQVLREATFTTDFAVDLEAQTITPDPTAEATLDNNLINLMCLNAACILDRGNAVLAAGKAVAGKDMGAVQFDLKGVAQSTLELLKQGWCKVYADVLWDYINTGSNLGEAVMSPFRLRARYSFPYITQYNASRYY